MLTENDVITAVCAELSRRGWETLSTATTRQRGDDVVASRANIVLRIEAKGATSSKPTTARFGVGFNARQVRTHVAMAVLRAMSVVSGGRSQAAIALPDDDRHRAEVAGVSRALDALGIGVFFVSNDGSVEVPTAWRT
jgi:hypothetical protein